MAVTANNTGNVSVTMFVQGGYFFSAPIGTALPNDYEAPLDAAFVNLGFIPEDGVAEDIEESQNVLSDVNGDTMAFASSSRVETIKLKLAEIKKDALSETYGHDNVTDAGGMITALHKSGGRQSRVYVLELLLKDGRKWRQIVTNGQVTELGTLTLGSTEIAARDLTITGAVDDNGVSVIDYIQSTETSK